VLVLRPDGPLFYANAQTLPDSLTELVSRADPPVHTVVLDLDANDSLDITTAETVAKLVVDLHRHQIRVGLAHAHSPVVEMLQRSGLLEALGDQRIFPDLTSAVTWAEAGPRNGPPAETARGGVTALTRQTTRPPSNGTSPSSNFSPVASRLWFRL